MALLQEVRRAARSLARAPVLSAVAVVSLGLGIGANATIFNFVNAIRFRPLPFPAAGRLVSVSEINPKELCTGCSVGTSWSTFQRWRNATTSYSGLGAYYESSYALAGEGEPERLGGAALSASVLPTLGVGPVLGRSLAEADELPASPPVVLLGYGLWQRRFGGDSGVIGRSVRVNGVARTVVGVMPQGFGFPEFASLWLPLAPNLAGLQDADRSLGVVGRLRTGVSLGQAGVEIEAIAARLAAEQATQQGWSAVVTPLKQDISHDASSDTFLLALAASGFVLLIACANLANLFLARSTTRARELAVRIALGASRTRIAGQVLAEAVLLGLGGGVLGLVLSLWGVRLLVASIKSGLPFWIQLGADWRFLLYILALSLVVGVAFGLLPAIGASRTDLNETLKSGAAGATAGRRESWVRGSLVIAQISLALVLLTGAGLMIKSFLIERRTAGLGFDPRNILTARLQLQAPQYDDAAQVRSLEAQLLEGLRRQPLVDAAAIESPLFLGAFIGNASRVQLEGATAPVPIGSGPGHGYAVSAEYFGLLGIPILSGRGFSSEDGAGSAPVAVVNHAAAEMYWPGANPLGRRLRIGDGPWLTIVGVAGDIANRPFGHGNLPLLYESAAQDPARPFRVMVHYRGDPGTATTTLKAVARTVDPDEPVEDVITLESDLALQLTPLRVMMLLLGTLGAIALGLAAFGVYGVMAYLVARRTRELGIRAALGAEAARLWRFVVARGLRLALTGITIGLIGAAALTRVLRQSLFNLRATDPGVFALVAALLAGIAVLACVGPARRATRADPMQALRAE